MKLFIRNSRYANNNRTRIDFFSSIGEPMATLTVNLVDVEMEDDEFVLEPSMAYAPSLMTFLENQGYIEPTGKIAHSGRQAYRIFCFPKPMPDELDVDIPEFKD